MPHYVWETLCDTAQMGYQLPVVHKEENPGIDPRCLEGAPTGDLLTKEAEGDKLAEVPETSGKGSGEDDPQRFPCPHCCFRSARRHNLCTHVATHGQKGTGAFECPECARRFSRCHDLVRH